MIRCQSCGHENQPIFRFCLRCGAELGSPEPAAAPPEPVAKRSAANDAGGCAHCGADVPKDLRFCVECGREVRPRDADDGPRDQVGQLVLIQADGSDGPSRPVFDGVTSIGGAAGDHVFPEDELMSPHHADIVVEAGDIRIFDRDSTYGTFARIQDAVFLGNGAQFRIGQQLLEIHLGSGEGPDVWGEVVRLAGGDEANERYTLEGENVFLGRERGHIVFPVDGYVSGSHAVLFRQDDGVMLKDLDSSNGTYARISEGTSLGANPFVLIGSQLFRVEID